MKKYALWTVYCVMFLGFLFKMFYYREEIYYVPDEDAHISYIAYVEENQDKWIPEFENMRICESVQYLEDGVCQYVLCNRTCYLGHPPLYYRLMRLVGGVVTVESDGQTYVYANLDRLKTANIYLTALTMILIFYIGYTRLGKLTDSPVWHGLYAAAVTSVPMLALCGSGITNDNLANMGVAVFMLGVLRYHEKKKGYLTYFLVAIGFFLSIMSKLTVGEFVVIMLVAILIADIIKNKNLGLIWNKYFLVTLPVYLIAAGYFMVILVRYGSLQPGLDVVAPSEQTFVAEAERANMNFISYIPYFFSQFSYTWTGIYNGRFFDLKMTDIWEGRIFTWILAAPFVFAAAAGIKCLKAAKQKDKNQMVSRYDIMYMAVAIGLFVTIATQLMKGYESFTTRGYTGGFQARYYLCDIPFMALAMTEGMYFLSKLSVEKVLAWCRGRLPLGNKLQTVKLEDCQKTYICIINVLGIIFIFWLIYGDFIYFLTTHSAY